MDKELEHLYSPSRWNKRMSADVIVDHHIELTSAETELVRSSVPNQRELRYGPGERQKYDIYGTNLPADAPMFVYIHGGYWQALNKDISAYCVAPLTQAGIKVAILGYSIAPQARLESIVEEVRNGLKVIISNANESGCRRVWIAGHSAGAHLVAMSLICNDDVPPGLDVVKGLVLISGVYHLAPLIHTSINEPLKLDKLAVHCHFSDQSFAASRERALRLSPLALVSQTRFASCTKKLKVLIVVAQHDSPAFIQQSREFAQALKGRIADVQFLEVEDVDHFSIVECLANKKSHLTHKIINLINSNK